MSHPGRIGHRVSDAGILAKGEGGKEGSGKREAKTWSPWTGQLDNKKPRRANHTGRE